MSHVLLNDMVHLELTAQEFRLVGLALSGRLNDKDGIKEAAELNVRLLEQTFKKATERCEVLQGALQKAREDVRFKEEFEHLKQGGKLSPKDLAVLEKETK